MYTEEVLKDFPLTTLMDLMAYKLHEFENIGDAEENKHEQIFKRAQIELIEKVIREKRKD